MLDAGNYRGRPISAALAQAGTGTLQVGVQFELADPAGQRITWYGFLSDGAIERTLESLRHCGWRGNDVRDFAAGQPLPDGFDQEVELVVEHEEYQGKTRARVVWVNSGGGLAVKNALSREQADSFAAKLQRQIDTLDRAAGRAPAARAAPAGARPSPSGASRPAPAARPQGRPAARAAPSQSDQPPLEILEEQSGGAPAGDDVPY